MPVPAAACFESGYRAVPQRKGRRLCYQALVVAALRFGGDNTKPRTGMN